MKVLFVEDEPAICRIASRMIGRKHELSIANTLAEARAHVGGSSFHLALVDNNLPDGMGTDFLGELADRAPSTLRVIMSGDHRSDENGGVFQRALNKPFGLVELRDILGWALERHGLEA